MDLDKWLAKKNMSEKKKSDIMEKKTAKRIGGKPTPASGALYFSKADITTKKFRIECKRTDKNQLIFKTDWLRKLQTSCLPSENPAFCIEIAGEVWYLVRESEFKHIMESEVNNS